MTETVEKPVCGWEVGTVWTGLRTCGRPAKGKVTPTNSGSTAPTRNGLVCGLHARSAEKAWQHTVEPLHTAGVHAGQVWVSLDRRESRHVLVDSADGHFAVVVRCGLDGQVHGRERHTRIRIVDGGLRGYQLVSDPSKEV